MLYRARECRLYASRVARCFQLNIVLIYEKKIWNRRGKVVKRVQRIFIYMTPAAHKYVEQYLCECYLWMSEMRN